MGSNARRIFTCGNDSKRPKDTAEEYCWAITEAAGPSCYGRSDSSMLSLDFNWTPWYTHTDLLNIHVSVHHDTIYENDQQDATVYDNLLFLGCSTCFELYFRSSSEASKMYYSFWYYTRISLPAGITGVFEQHSHDTRDAPDDVRKYRSKHVEQPRNNKLSYTVASRWSFSYIIQTYS